MRVVEGDVRIAAGIDAEHRRARRGSRGVDPCAGRIAGHLLDECAPAPSARIQGDRVAADADGAVVGPGQVHLPTVGGELRSGRSTVGIRDAATRVGTSTCRGPSRAIPNGGIDFRTPRSGRLESGIQRSTEIRQRSCLAVACGIADAAGAAEDRPRASAGLRRKDLLDRGDRLRPSNRHFRAIGSERDIADVRCGRGNPSAGIPPGAEGHPD